MKREDLIIQSLAKLDYLTTRQIVALHDLKSERNARRVLQNMADRLHSTKLGENVYWLNAKGRDLALNAKRRTGTGNVWHYIMRNSIYIRCGSPMDWRNEIKITSKGATKKDTVSNVCDALFKRANRWHIVEVDHTTHMHQNKRKMDKYRKLIERGAFGEHPPAFIWATTSERRRRALLALCDGLKVEVYVHSDII